MFDRHSRRCNNNFSEVLSTMMVSSGDKYSTSREWYFNLGKTKCTECIGPEGEIGMLRAYMEKIAMNLCGHDLLQQWKTRIKILSIY